MTDRIVFVDVETTGLDPDRHEPWEIAMISGECTYEWQIPVDLVVAEPMALQIGGFYQRADQAIVDHYLHRWHGSYGASIARRIASLVAGAHLAGAVPSFDAAFLARFLQRHGWAPAWKHRLICVENVAAGALGLDVPVGLAKSAQLLGLPVDEDAAHTAKYDAELARDVYVAALGRARTVRP